MPRWSPNWEDVRWDFQAATAAATALRRMSNELERYSFERGDAGIAAVDGWLGPHRRDFDQDFVAGLRELRFLATDCRQQAQTLLATNQRARAEQQRRERERDEWHRESARERARQTAGIP
ncbi:MAG: hypothetical protein HC822_01265 [Oscillochloris sp.]|nr:hypothetical protein [Oscillochloris sp.]